MARILLVEDDPDNQDVLATMLQIAGQKVVIAPDGTEGIRLATELQPDIILMDMGMGVMDGWTATAQLKAHADLAHIPIIAVTAYATIEDARRAFAAGCDDYIPKPVDYHVLIGKIEEFLIQGCGSGKRESSPSPQ
jgi:two-component system cell cycle response regulator DivK